jgi:hypothetical protein
LSTQPQDYCSSSRQRGRRPAGSEERTNERFRLNRWFELSTQNKYDEEFWNFDLTFSILPTWESQTLIKHVLFQIARVDIAPTKRLTSKTKFLVINFQRTMKIFFKSGNEPFQETRNQVNSIKEMYLVISKQYMF